MDSVIFWLLRQSKHVLTVCNICSPPPPCVSYALVQATVGVGTVIIVYVILITYKM